MPHYVTNSTLSCCHEPWAASLPCPKPAALSRAPSQLPRAHPWHREHSSATDSTVINNSNNNSTDNFGIALPGSILDRSGISVSTFMPPFWLDISINACTEDKKGPLFLGSKRLIWHTLLPWWHCFLCTYFTYSDTFSLSRIPENYHSGFHCLISLNFLSNFLSALLP